VITHPEKLLFPDDGISKGELAAYYEAVAPLMLPHVRGRPLTMERFPAGIAKKGFIQKDVSKGFPEWLERVEVPKKGGTSWYPIVNDAKALQWISNQNSITPHVWTSRVPSLHNPDLCIFDLDPSHDEPDVLRAVALEVRNLLAELGLQSWLKTSGSKGFHIAVPLDGTAEFDAVSQFTHGVGALLVKQNPSQLTQEFLKADREGRILIDTGRNRFGATFAAAYAVRPKPGAPVSAPCSWQELEQDQVAPQTFTLRNLPERCRERGDLWANIYERGQSLREPSEKLARRLNSDELRAAFSAAGRKPKKRSQAPKPAKRET
jgi:bifunctional non-homologous end joining protein LigD